MSVLIKCDVCELYSNTTKLITVLNVCHPCRMVQKDGPILDYRTVDEHDDMSCVCGNQTHLEGFYPCLESGESIEPDIGSGWVNLFKCDKCGQIFRDLDISVSSETVTEVSMQEPISSCRKKDVSGLSLYNAEAKCSKCGFGFITSKHTTQEWDDECQWYVDSGEHIARKCCNCGYKWKEVPLDSA